MTYSKVWMIELSKVWSLLFLTLVGASISGQNIDRQKVYERHKVYVNKIDSLEALTVGNGNFAFTVDATGLQTFPQTYQKGIALGTQSDWGWHSFPNTNNHSIDQTLDTVQMGGRNIPYAVQSKNPEIAPAVNYIRQNPHRIHLGQLGWQFAQGHQKLLLPQHLKNIHQTLNPWTGIINSSFEWQGERIDVETFSLQDRDAVVVQVKTNLLTQQKLKLRMSFPYPTDTFLDEATHYRTKEHDFLKTHLAPNKKKFWIDRTLDDLSYRTQFSSSTPIKVMKTANGFEISPQTQGDIWQFVLHFHQRNIENSYEVFQKLKDKSIDESIAFWQKGGIIDFGATTDPRAHELERRMVLSRYLTKVNCSGPNPPQETGLTLNSWYGKPHMEMHWWHALPFYLWGNEDVFENQLNWYFRAFEGAKKIAQRQGFQGVRWQKMTDPWGGETASSVGSFLIWQQPHILYFTELLYQKNPSKKLLLKFQKLVEETALFMGDFLTFNPKTNSYDLGPYIIPAQENFIPKETQNPTYELTYWKWGLQTAQKWQKRLEKLENLDWTNKIQKMTSPDGNRNYYWAAASHPYPYNDREQMSDHPSVLGAIAMVPDIDFIDKQKMKRTLLNIKEKWQWESCWGWDFPLAAMAAQRLDEGSLAIEFLLMPFIKNTYLNNGHNYQTPRLRLYLPGNGGLLIVLARMALDPGKGGFPQEWKVKSEGLNFDL